MLWEALQELIEENEKFEQLFKLNLYGIVSDDVVQSIHEHSLKNYTNVLGYVSHEDALKAQMHSRVLLLVEVDSEDTKAIIPGKLFEYLASETPILAIGPENSDVEQIIKTTNTGHYFTYKQKQDIKFQIMAYFNAFLNEALKIYPIGLKQYSRKELTSELAKLI
jgi:hypothetical protein